MITWVIFLAVGILIGIGVGIYMSRLDDEAKRTQNSLNQQLQQKDQEMTAYKEQVNSHFVTTASLVNNMTESYRAVHEHLTTGVNNLCQDGADVNSIPFENKKMIAEESATIAPVEKTIEATTSASETAVSQPSFTNEPSEKESSAPSEMSTGPESVADIDSKIAQHEDVVLPESKEAESKVAESEKEPTLPESKAVEADQTLDSSEPKRVAVTENSDTPSDDAGKDNPKQDNMPTEPAVTEIDKSRVNASRMVH